MKRRWIAVLGALTLSAGTLTAGCAGVPSSSEPVAVRHVNPSDVGGDIPPDVQFVPPPPSPHMSTRDIVDGFLRASSSEVDAGHQVARRYLTPDAAADWQDTAQAVIYNQPLVDDIGNGQVTVTAQHIATIAQDGSYHPPTDPRAIVSFQLVKVKGEWRISNPPPGIYVKKSDFAQNFHSVDVYFLNPSRTALVPDPRYFEAPNSSMANRLMQALLAGPSQWLQPAVVTDVPIKAQLRNPVVDDSPTLTVDLDHLGSLSKSQLKGMSAQIVYTLTKYSGSQVRILSDGQPLAVPGEQEDQQQADWQSYDAQVLPASAQLYVIRDGAVWTGDGKRAPGPAGQAYYELNSVAVSLDGKKMAGVSHRQHHDELFIGPTGKTMVGRFGAASLTPPTWGGQSGEVWTVRDGTDVIAVPADGSAKGVKIPALGLARIAPITELRLSRDGTKVALIGHEGRLYVARVSHNSGGSTIDGLQQLAKGRSGFKTLSWANGDEVVALAPNTTFSVVPWEIAVDGSGTHADNIDTLPASPSAIAAAANQLTTVVAKHELWYYERTTWVRSTGSQGGQTVTGEALAYPD